LALQRLLGRHPLGGGQFMDRVQKNLLQTDVSRCKDRQHTRRILPLIDNFEDSLQAYVGGRRWNGIADFFDMLKKRL
jgi:hypothetical protein